MAKKSVSKKRVPPKKSAPGAASGRNLKTRAFGEAADAFGKEVVPLGPRAGALAVRVGNLLLSMLEGAVFGLEYVDDWLRDAVSKRLRNVPESEIVKPDLRIAVPAVQALVYSMNDEQIREMFANLLASNMNAQTRANTHPAFVEMIKEMTPSDAKALQHFRPGEGQVEYEVQIGYRGKSDALGMAYSFELENVGINELKSTISNLVRLGLIERRLGIWPVLPSADENMVDDNERALTKEYAPQVNAINTDPEALKKLNIAGRCELRIGKNGLLLTPLGQMFIDACIR